MAKASVFKSSISAAIKKFLLVVSLPKCRLQTTQEVKYLQGGGGGWGGREDEGLIWRRMGCLVT